MILLLPWLYGSAFVDFWQGAFGGAGSDGIGRIGRIGRVEKMANGNMADGPGAGGTAQAGE